MCGYDTTFYHDWSGCGWAVFDGMRKRQRRLSVLDSGLSGNIASVQATE